jgi:predicted CXXCH cytochrome family protein
MMAKVFSFNGTGIAPVRRHAEAVGFACLLLLLNSPGRAASIVDSRHNLSVSGPGNIKAVTEKEICIFCHTPHQSTGEVPLWNHEMSVQSYTPYSSSTLKATVGQPTGASKLCLSCHDGTVAVGMVHTRSSPIVMRNAITTIPVGRTRLGTDLSDDHPISFKYDAALAAANPQLNQPAILNQRVRLDASGQMQCTACHDPHNDQFGQFLVIDNTGSALCMVCHNQNLWNVSIHKTSTATWNRQGPNPWPHTTGTTVAANGCENCHTPHQAGTRPRLLNYSVAEQNCFTCHDGNVAAKNIQKEFTKFSAHPITTTSQLHDEAEDLINPPRHVSCVDCHNPHAVQASAPATLHAPGSLLGVKGLSPAGTIVNPVTTQYELCFRCHADSIARGRAVVPRNISETNKRLQFQPSNLSFHPIEVTGKNPNVPSLIAPWTVASLMTCTDCHNNDQGPGAGGTGPRGPHGSAFSPLLEQRLVFSDYTPESPAAYALCYQCHSRNSILGDQSFKAVNSSGQARGHQYHIVVQQAACTTCHDSHGVVSMPHLINFNTIYVTPSSTGASGIQYITTGKFSGNCTLTCHGFNHAATSYPTLSSSAVHAARPASVAPMLRPGTIGIKTAPTPK